MLLGPGKLGGILLERNGDRVVVGFGVNLVHAPSDPDRPAASLAEIALVSPEAFAPLLAASFARALNLWRSDGEALRAMWLESAHPVGSLLRVHDGDGHWTEGSFDGLEPDGALRLRLPDGEARIIHAGDVGLG